MFKQLYIAFTAEGSTDEVFLGTIIRRTLEDISLRQGHTFIIGQLIWLGAAKGKKTTTKALDTFDNHGAQILIIHRDTDDESRSFIIEHHIKPIQAKLPITINTELQIVPLIIRHEQETWLFADLDALNEAMEGKLDRRSLNLPPNIETRANTKEIFKQTIRDANKQDSRGRGIKESAVIETLAGKIHLAHLARLPSYQHFVADLETALRKIDYIR